MEPFFAPRPAYPAPVPCGRCGAPIRGVDRNTTAFRWPEPNADTWTHTTCIIAATTAGDEPIYTDDDAERAFADETASIDSWRALARRATHAGDLRTFFTAAAACAKAMNRRAELVTWGPAALAR